MESTNHPCFNAAARHSQGRIHLPVAPLCNVQCNFCSRKFDCVNEARPGVTSAVLSPWQALYWLDQVCTAGKNIAVAGIAGPGDPFANPEETLMILRLVREKYPQLLLCAATNGVDLAPYVDELARLAVSHVTVTVNAVDPAIAEQIYAWVRTGKHVYRGKEAAEIIVTRQQEAVRLLKARGITTKINSIIIPGINDAHIPAVAAAMAGLHADIFNCIPLYKTPGSAFAALAAPDEELVQRVRSEAGRFIPQMHHCTRCRADAIGLLGETPDQPLLRTMREIARLPCNPYAASGKKNIAVASREGWLINEHLGRAEAFYIYSGDGVFMEMRKAPGTGGDERWAALAAVLHDCYTVLAAAAGTAPKISLQQHNIRVITVEGIITEVVAALVQGKDIAKTAHVTTGRSCPGPGAGRTGCL